MKQQNSQIFEQSHTRDLARLLFTRGLIKTYEELAIRVNAPVSDIQKWAKEESWDEQARSMLVVREVQLARMYRLLENEVNLIESMQQEGIPLNAKQAAGIERITNAIKNLETELSVAEVVDSFMRFNDWLRRSQPNKLQELAELQDAFIKNLL